MGGASSGPVSFSEASSPAWGRWDGAGGSQLLHLEGGSRSEPAPHVQVLCFNATCGSGPLCFSWWCGGGPGCLVGRELGGGMLWVLMGSCCHLTPTFWGTHASEPRNVQPTLRVFMQMHPQDRSQISALLRKPPIIQKSVEILFMCACTFCFSCVSFYCSRSASIKPCLTACPEGLANWMDCCVYWKHDLCPWTSPSCFLAKQHCCYRGARRECRFCCTCVCVCMCTWRQCISVCF